VSAFQDVVDELPHRRGAFLRFFELKEVGGFG